MSDDAIDEAWDASELAWEMYLEAEAEFEEVAAAEYERAVKALAEARAATKAAP